MRALLLRLIDLDGEAARHRLDQERGPGDRSGVAQTQAETPTRAHSKTTMPVDPGRQRPLLSGHLPSPEKGSRT